MPNDTPVVKPKPSQGEYIYGGSTKHGIKNVFGNCRQNKKNPPFLPSRLRITGRILVSIIYQITSMLSPYTLTRQVKNETKVRNTQKTFIKRVVTSVWLLVFTYRVDTVNITAYNNKYGVGIAQ